MKIDWAKWGKVGAVVAITSLGVPEVQSALPPGATPYVNAFIAAWALLHRYQPTEQPPTPQEPPKS